uniref:Serine/threonine protein kinase n=1 Tax=Streptomyces sp. NBC_01401 TaxID=2903854 RepID=A0AAU3GRZ4_9ACTN
MHRSSPLPPPPPPVEIRTWPDRDALLRDRALVLGELVKMFIGPGRLGILWMWAGVAALGWSLAGSAFLMFEDAYDTLGVVPGVICLAIGVAVLIPAAVLMAVGVARDLRVHRLLVEWGGLDRDPRGDMALRRPRASLAWLLMSFALCAVGLFGCVAVPATARAGEETYGLVAWLVGLGFIGWLTGLTGILKAVSHRRWVLRVLAGVPADPLVTVRG